MLSNTGEIVGDGRWELRVLVTDLSQEIMVRVSGDLHVGGVMLKLVEKLDVNRDWSDHALWWPGRCRWLSHTRSSLDQYGIAADSLLHFTPMHKVARVQLPDLQFIDALIDFSVPVFRTVVQLGKDLGIRYPEEVSFKRYIDPDELKKPLVQVETHRRQSLSASGGKKADKGRLSGVSLPNSDSLCSRSGFDLSASASPLYSIGGPSFSAHNLTPVSAGGSTMPITGGSFARASPGIYYTINGNLSSASPSSPHSMSFDGSTLELEQCFVLSPKMDTTKALEGMLRPKTISQKASLNRGWLDSSRSLMEQGINEYDTVLFRFKYLTLYDLNMKYDSIRMNQIYEQAKWSILSEEVDVTEEEVLMFAALQLQIELQSSIEEAAGESSNGSIPNGHGGKSGSGRIDDVESALDELQSTLEGSHVTSVTPDLNSTSSNAIDITAIPELAESLKFLKPKKFTLKGWRSGYFVLRDLSISHYRSESDYRHASGPATKYFLKGSEVTPDVHLSQGKFCIRLLIPSAEGMTEFWLRCSTAGQYAKWMGACRLGAKGKTMADANYSQEVETIKKLLTMQHQASSNSIRRPQRPIGPQEDRKAVPTPSLTDLDPDDYLPLRFIKKWKSKSQLLQKILDAQANVKDLSLVDGKLHYIRAWQSLPDFGIHYFVVKFLGSRKPELIGIAFNRLIRMGLERGDSVKTWRFNTMQEWHVNWETKSLMIKFEDEQLIFCPISATCKVVHEYIGGYIFLSLRSKDQNQVLNEEHFHKLTGGGKNGYS